MMINRFFETSSRRARGLLGCCALGLLSACGGAGGDAKRPGPAGKTAAEVIDSAAPNPAAEAEAEAEAAASIAGTSADETAGAAATAPDPAAGASEPGLAAAPPQQPAVTDARSVAPGPAAAGAARIFVAGNGAPALL